MHQEHRLLQKALRFWLWLGWVTLTTLGGIVGNLIIIGNYDHWSFLYYFFFISPLFFVSLGQWFLLKHFFPSSGRWLLTGVLGFPFYFLYFYFYAFSYEFSGGHSQIFGTRDFWSATVTLTIVALLFGLAVGVFQSRVIVRRNGVRGAWAWIIANILAYGAGYPLIQQFLASLNYRLAGPVPSYQGMILVLYEGLPWLAIGIITGIIFIRLISEPAEASRNGSNR